MKAQLYIVTLPLFAVVAFAQSPVPPQPTPAAQDSKATNASPAPTRDRASTSEMMTRNYSGNLVDVSCVTAGSIPAGGSAKPAPETTGASATAQTGKTTVGDSTHAATTDQGRSCSPTASTMQFAIKLKDGQIVKLDDVGNQRAQEALKAKKKWIDAAASGKSIHVDASGVLNGDKLIAMSLN